MIHHHLSRQQSFVILLFGPTSVTPSLNDVFFVSLFFILFVFVRGIGKVKGLTVSLAHFLWDQLMVSQNSQIGMLPGTSSVSNKRTLGTSGALQAGIPIGICWLPGAALFWSSRVTGYSWDWPTVAFCHCFTCCVSVIRTPLKWHTTLSGESVALHLTRLAFRVSFSVSQNPWTVMRAVSLLSGHLLAYSHFLGYHPQIQPWQAWLCWRNALLVNGPSMSTSTLPIHHFIIQMLGFSVCVQAP